MNLKLTLFYISWPGTIPISPTAGLLMKGKEKMTFPPFILFSTESIFFYTEIPWEKNKISELAYFLLSEIYFWTRPKWK